MRRREAKASAKDEQLDLPFDRRTRRARTNGAEPLAVRIPDAVRMTGIGRSKLYQLIASGELETVKIGRCTLITLDALKGLLANAQSPNSK
ncbi:helix-turn-helix domain-containing protein [Novosphingobium jiangmenense]|uniref:Helix-turn-helix domain-containing protein n=1 Tax=Novosphingobium jiangmenense TaxID=2791981 RepID=A0ABS0HDT9_9SPHN|nr:helix-turn-helix domain-containing protein [Novosphingobium jiangmenense]